MDLQERFAPLMAAALHYAGSAEGLAMPLKDIQARLLVMADEERARSALDAEDGLPDGSEERRSGLEDARFAVYAWADEKILNAPRPDAGDWLPLSLQYRYFSTTEGGEQFFSRLDAVLDTFGIAREADGESRDWVQRLELACGLSANNAVTEVLRVFALCLLYGFRGRLHGQDELLARVRKTCRMLLRRPETAAPALVTTKARENRQMLLQRIEAVACVVVPVVVCVLFWLFCANILAHIPGQGG